MKLFRFNSDDGNQFTKYSFKDKVWNCFNVKGFPGYYIYCANLITNNNPLCLSTCPDKRDGHPLISTETGSLTDCSNNYFVGSAVKGKKIGRASCRERV